MSRVSTLNVTVVPSVGFDLRLTAPYSAKVSYLTVVRPRPIPDVFSSLLSATLNV